MSGDQGTSAPAATGLVRIDASEKIMSLCTGGEASLKFIQDMGKTLAESRMLKLKNPQQGAAVVFASICEGTTPFQLMREYHIMDDGGMAMKADAMLAKFNAAGGKHKWIEDGRNGKALLRLFWQGETTDVPYTIDDAKTAKLIRPNGNWEKNPASMLRARATSEGIRMVCPGVIAGLYCPEDFAEEVEASATTPAKSRKTSATTDASTAASTAENTPAKTEPEVVDAVAEPAATAAAETVPFDGGSTPSHEAYEADKVQMEIDSILGELGKTRADIEAGIRAKNPKFTTIDALTLDNAKKLLEGLRAKKQQAAASAS